VAVKVLRPELGAALGSERFLREIEVTAHLSHPHILPLLDSGRAVGRFYESDCQGQTPS
jgi:serine/threonine-protein kinase